MTNQDFHRYLLLWGWFFAVIMMEGEVETESESLERLSLWLLKLDRVRLG